MILIDHCGFKLSDLFVCRLFCTFCIAFVYSFAATLRRGLIVEWIKATVTCLFVCLLRLYVCYFLAFVHLLSATLRRGLTGEWM